MSVYYDPEDHGYTKIESVLVDVYSEGYSERREHPEEWECDVCGT